MDRFIPNRSASNLDVASFNVSREARDVENLDALSPTKVRSKPEEAELDRPPGCCSLAAAFSGGAA